MTLSNVSRAVSIALAVLSAGCAADADGDGVEPAIGQPRPAPTPSPVAAPDEQPGETSRAAAEPSPKATGVLARPASRSLDQMSPHPLPWMPDEEW
jgi:hypothetical protein